MKNTATATFDLDVLRGAKWIATYHFTGTLSGAKEAARKALDLHCGAVVAILNSGLNVGTVR